MDSETKQRILDGDLDAYGDCVRDHQGMLMGYAMRRLGDWRLAEEVVQLTFIRAYQKLGEFDPEKEFGVWLCVTCKYFILTELEKKRREARNQTNYQTKLELEVATAAAEDLEVDQLHDQLSALRRCVEGLKTESASLIELRYFEKLSCKEIAEQKNRTVTWVTSTLSRVRKSLQQCLENQTIGSS